MEKLKIENTRIKSILKAIIEGVPVKSSLRANNLSDAFYFKIKKLYENYLKEYQAGLNNGEEVKGKNIKINNSNDNINISISGVVSCVAFYGALLQCSALCLGVYLKALKDEKGANWSKWAWLLERQFKDEFSKEKQESEGVATVEAIKIIFANPKDQNKRLEQLTEEVKGAILNDRRSA